MRRAFDCCVLHAFLQEWHLYVFIYLSAHLNVVCLADISLRPRLFYIQ